MARHKSEWRWVAIAAVAAFVIIAVVIPVASLVGNLWVKHTPAAESVVSPGTTTPTSGLVSVNKPVQFIVANKFAGGVIPNVTIAIYKAGSAGLVYVGGGTTDSHGSYTTVMRYPSGTVLYVFLKSGNAKIWYKVVVPKMSPDDAKTADTNQVVLYLYTLPTLNVKLADPNGNTYASGDNITLAGQKGTYSLYLMGNDGTGYIPSYNYLNGTKWNAYVVVKVPSGVLVKGAVASYNTGNGYIEYLIPLSASYLTYLKGSTSTTHIFPLQIDASAFTGTTGTVTISIVVNADAQYFTATGYLGPDATTVASMTLNVV